MKISIADLRKDYKLKSLDILDVLPNPIDQFKVWFQEAVDSAVLEANAMVLATSNEHNIPNARVLLLKGVDENGFVFFTNYESLKGLELAHNPHAAMVFCWLEIERQVRIQGRVEKITESESIEYFQSRPKGSQIGAWVSPQSQVITNRNILEEKQLILEKEYSNVEVLPKPAHWGGYRLVPTNIEFWQGRSSRLHDRIFYTFDSDKNWKIERLAP